MTVEHEKEESSLYVTVNIADQMFGVQVLMVHDVLAPQRVTHIPLAPSEVAGALNLRGRIVTAIDMRVRLGLPPHPGSEGMSIVVESGNELYSLMVDSVGEVLSLNRDDYERNPATLDGRWRDVASGIFRLEGMLLVVLDVRRVLNFVDDEKAIVAA